jgi:hypothetical protein
MAQILLNSPYLVKDTVAGLGSASLEVWVKQGNKTDASTGTAQFILQTKAYNNYVMFDISKIARDFINSPYDSAIWVSYRITRVVSGVSSTLSTVTLAGVYGYGYFMQGHNPQVIPASGRTLMQDNTELYIPEGRAMTFPLLTETAQLTRFISNGVVRNSNNASAATTSTNLMTYNNLTNSLYTWGTNERKLWSAQRNFNLVSNVALSPVEYNFDTYEVGDILTVIKVIEIECTKHTPVKVYFRNKYGAYQEIWFFGRSTEISGANKEKYKRNIKTIDYYDTTKHVDTIMNVTSSTKRVLNTGFYPESFNEVFKQLILSDKVWIYENDQNIPVNINNSELRHKTSLADKLINYEFEFEYAFNEINNIR